MGVGVNNVEKVVRAVLSNIAGINVDQLPKATFSRIMFTEARGLSQIQVAETLLQNYENDSRTLHTDGTSKFGQHYGTYDIVGESGPLVAGLRLMETGDTQTQMNVLNEILTDIESSMKNSEHSISKKIVSSIKNVMSDRHIVQKKFNTVFQEYRANALPDIVQGWSELTTLEQSNMSKINDFFCGMHYIVGLADQAEVALKAWDKLLWDDKLVGSLAHGGYSQGGESGTLRLIRTLCKSVQTRGCEKSGRMIDFSSFLNQAGISSVPFATFKGNRFNILFYNGGVAYYLYDLCNKFFEDVKEENKLLKAVYYDLQVLSHIAGCRALGLINKCLTGPLWRLLETNIHILDLNEHLQKMELLLSELSSDATPFLSGEITFFENISISKDDVFNELIRPSEVFDEPTKQCLEIMFGCFSIITKRMLHDHLEGGKYDNPSPQLVEETKNVMKTNTLSERNFGMLDRLMREKPNANLITFEAIIMCQTNKTSSWRNNLTPERRSTLMKWARESTKKQCADFKVRRAEMRAKQNEARLNKIEMKRNREMRAVLLKQNLITAVGKYGGLWSSEEMVDTKLTKFESLAMKREALKCQIQFRQKILPPCNINKKLFQLSEKGKNKSIEMLTRNLKTLITEIIKSTAIVVETERVDICDIVIPKNKLDSEKERLKLLLASECNKLKKKDIVSNGPSKAKKKKSNNVELEKTDSDCIPIVTSIDELIGKKVKHLTVDYDGQEKWFSGIVVCVKPDTTTE